MKRFYRMLASCLALLLGFGTAAIGQQQEQPDGERRAGTNAASELLIPIGSRYTAMGGSSIATVTGLEAIYWNPAGLARAERGANAMFSHMRYIADVNVNYLAVSAAFSGLGTLGFSVKALDIGAITVTTEDSPDGTGEIITPQFVTAGLTYSRVLTDRIAVGATVNIISETIDRVGATGIALTVGVQYNDLVAINGLSLGVALKNIGPGIKYGGSGLLRQADPLDVERGSSPYQVVAGTDELPSSLEIGLGYRISMGEKSNLNLTSLYQDNNFDDDATRIGAEYSFDNLLFVRGGYSYAFNAGDDPAGESRYIFGPAFGAGLHRELGGLDVSLDYAFRQVQFFDSSNVFTLKLGF